jgi:uncharacterized protein YoxC
MNKINLYLVLTIVALIVLFIFFFVDKKKMGRQNIEISELEIKVQQLEKKVSELESEKDELEKKVSELTEIDNNYNENNSNFNDLNFTPQTFNKKITDASSFATIVYRPSSCDYFILENSSGYIIAEWMSGNDPDQGDIITGKFNSYGTKDFYNQSRERDCRFWIDDYMLSKERALEKIREKCN